MIIYLQVKAQETESEAQKIEVDKLKKLKMSKLKFSKTEYINKCIRNFYRKERMIIIIVLVNS